MPGTEAAPRPAWRRAFDVAERAAARCLEPLATSEEFAIAVGIARRARHAGQTRWNAALARGLHMWNLPANTDVQRVTRHIGRLEARLATMAHELEVLQHTAAPETRNVPTRPRHAAGPQRRRDSRSKPPASADRST
jgi:hypothetical protein